MEQSHSSECLSVGKVTKGHGAVNGGFLKMTFIPSFQNLWKFIYLQLSCIYSNNSEIPNRHVFDNLFVVMTRPHDLFLKTFMLVLHMTLTEWNFKWDMWSESCSMGHNAMMPGIHYSFLLRLNSYPYYSEVKCSFLCTCKIWHSK